MAIQINKPITTREGNNLESYYCRVEPTISKDGLSVRSELYFYASKQAFKNNSRTIDRNSVIVIDSPFTTLLQLHTDICEKLINEPQLKDGQVFQEGDLLISDIEL